MITHSGGEVDSLVTLPAAIRSIQITPMVFWASLPPWPRLYDAADSSCRRRNQVSTLRGGVFTKIQDTASITIEPRMKPSSGDRMIHSTVLIRPSPLSAWVPPLATAAPTRPPIRACEDEDGMP